MINFYVKLKSIIMAFRRYFPKVATGHCEVQLPVEVQRSLSDGRIEVDVKCTDGICSLPDYREFEASNMEAAGVVMNRVNCKLLNSDEIEDAALFEKIKSTDLPDLKPEKES